MRDRTFLILLSLLLSEAVSGCSPAQIIPNSDSDAAKLYSLKCGRCHAVRHPDRHTPEQWKFTLRKMEYMGMPPLKDTERTIILDYLKEHAIH